MNPSDLRDLRLPSLDGLLAFVAAARHGTFERAAEELCVTGSAVAKRVAALEQLLGVQLLVRSGKALTLTAAGNEYLHQVHAPLHLLAAVPLHRRNAGKTERLRICAPPTFARQILVARLDAFTLAHPGVELEVMLASPFPDAPPTGADLWIRGGGPIVSGATVLMVDALTPLAAPSLVERFAPLRRPADLAALPLLCTPLEPWTPWFRVAGLDWPEPANGPKLLDLGLLLEAAVSGQGVALGSPALARPWLAAGALVPLFPRIVRPAAPYYLMPYAPRAAAGAFAAWLAEVCERAVRDGAEFLSRHG
ncbi:LysR family transcriptional regulator [Burkholderia pseudomallei]|uniref:LysR family transcriptional regulator n=1 Tax=Burkholderia pseudomallei (strain K96243) TaxID=272560 RepID=Q63IE9_BURPS|nr:LysR substrate-binding domain-containing protein [Burkholderia pseudomallei]AHE35359.1 bacterial regulatory helix-turn-helix, lysR family protein [Burkholderia pseudomallei NAU20B-16]AHG38652.1 bacterial regulatory helix-turn-helix, lysR family protein [Burkholderia pseudomallei MSHR511]AHG72132.1 bacterial regulatory helix-turn-helix, lysR family protein [Burkholderia pseudomallei MSHR146]AIO85021.1 bacterial regulatory helix-turn-helix, lysR family protein [Burkholderia pseudomallei]AIP45